MNFLQGDGEKEGMTHAGASAANPPPVARMPHASLPSPKKGPHHAPKQGAPPQSLFGLSFAGNFGIPLQGTVASTPADAAAAIPPYQMNQLLAVQQQGGLGVFDTTTSVGRSAKMPRKREAPLSVEDASLTARGGLKRQRGRSTKKRGRPSTSSGKVGGRGSGGKVGGGRGRPKSSNTSRTPRKMTIQDEDAKRLVNPLVDVPYVEESTLTPPQAHDLVAVHNGLSFCRNDTFPLSYYARLLGFEVPKAHEVSQHWSNKSVALNVNSLGLADRSKDAVYSIPSLGTWYRQAQNHGSLSLEDPLYTALLQQQHQQGTPTDSIPLMTKGLISDVLSTLECQEGVQSHLTTTVSLDGTLFSVKLGTLECDYNFSWIPLDSKVSELILQVVGVKLAGDVDDIVKKYLMVVTSLILQHARSHHVWYGVWQHVPKEVSSFLETYFGMTAVTPAPTSDSPATEENVATATAMAKSLYEAAATMVVDSPSSPKPKGAVTTTAETLGHHAAFMSTSSLLCDLHKCSTRHAFLLHNQDKKKERPKKSPVETKQRLLVRLPTIEQVTGLPVYRRNKQAKSTVTGAKEAVRGIAFGVRITTSKDGDSSVKIEALNGNGQVVERNDGTLPISIPDSVAKLPPSAPSPAETGSQDPPVSASVAASDALVTKPSPSLLGMDPNIASVATTVAKPPPPPLINLSQPPSWVISAVQPPSWDVLKSFELVVPSSKSGHGVDENDEILRDLKAKQAELLALEGGMEPKLRSLLQTVVDERMEYEKNAEKRDEEQQLVEEYEKILDRRKEIDSAWQKQLEQDMDAVCEICRDGEVTPDNQILFCEACNVAVHQMCYGIEEVPEGDYYCIACRYLGRDKMSEALSQRGGESRRPAPSPLPICCELCPQKQGAFFRSDTSSLQTRNADGSSNPVLSRWVHVVCAKWQGLNFEPLDQTEVVEDVQELKKDFLRHGVSCILCLGKRGAYNQCRHEGCGNWMHMTCARASGLCEVSHGQNCHGDVGSNPWTLLCPEHSTIDPATVEEDRVPIEQLVRSAEEFPPEPYLERIRERPKKTFNKMSAGERRKFLADPEYEQQLLDEISRKLHGVHCEVCYQFEEGGRNLKKCTGCGVVFCESCVIPGGVDVDPDEAEYRCPACKYIAEMEKEGSEYQVPQCLMCNQKGGWLRKAYADPVNRKSYWKHNPEELRETLFAKDLWCHAVCTMWHPKVTASVEDGTVNCSSIVMSNGTGLILEKVRCFLCGDNRKMKVSCSQEGCRCWGQKKGPYSFHVTCAREAGLEVRDKQDENGDYYFDLKCYQHGGEDYAFRARMEDLIELERKRAGKRFEKDKYDYTNMSLAHAARLYNKAIIVMKMLGWAWRWAEWWVEFGDNWEPLLEPGEKEEEMTKEQLKIVDTTRESRCAAARKCRLAAFGAALRNRDYDKEEGDEFVALDRALRAVLHTPEIVGPLEQFEIDFYAEWLARVYRSKSRLLGFGDDKIPVQDYVRLIHVDDGSPKYELGARRLPGKQELPEGEIFESGFHDVDDFLKPETFEDGTLVTPESLQTAVRQKRRKDDDHDESPTGKRKRGGRKPKSALSKNRAEPRRTTVTLTAVYTTATADELSQENEFRGEDATTSRLQLLPSPVQALIVESPSDERRKTKPSKVPTKPPGKRSGRKPKQRGRPTSDPDAEKESFSAEMGKSSDEEFMPETTPAPIKRRGRPPRSRSVSIPPTKSAIRKAGRAAGSGTVLEHYVVEEGTPAAAKAAPSPKKRGRATRKVAPESESPKRRGRPPKASKVVDQLEPVNPTTDRSGNIAERIKRRRNSPEGIAEQNEKASAERLRDDDGAVEKEKDDNADQQDSSKRSAETAASVVESNTDGNDEDDVAISVFVQRERGAQGEDPTTDVAQSGKANADSTDSSSEND